MRLGIGIGIGFAQGSGVASIAGALAGALADATLSGTAKIIVAGVMVATLGNATVVGTASVPAQGTVAITTDDATAVGTGAVKVQGTAAVTADDATLSATGTAADPLGTELITNGDISGGVTGWNDLSSVGTCTFTGGVITTAANDLLLSNAGTEASVSEGVTYRVSYEIKTVTTPGDGVGVRIGTSGGLERTTPGVYTEDLVATDIENEGGFRLAAVSTPVTMTFDNFSCREVL